MTLQRLRRDDGFPSDQLFFLAHVARRHAFKRARSLAVAAPPARVEIDAQFAGPRCRVDPFADHVGVE